MALTLEMLERMPDFAPVRVALRELCDFLGSAHIRRLIMLGHIPADPVITKWMLDEMDHETYEHRKQALFLVIEEWEKEQAGLDQDGPPKNQS